MYTHYYVSFSVVFTSPSTSSHESPIAFHEYIVSTSHTHTHTPAREHDRYGSPVRRSQISSDDLCTIRAYTLAYIFLFTYCMCTRVCVHETFPEICGETVSGKSSDVHNVIRICVHVTCVC